QVFERNPGAEKLYNLDRPGLGRVRIVLTDAQHEVLKRMKRVRGVRGELKESLRRDPVQVFDGIADDIDLPYGDRVIGIGEFPFAPMPHPGFGHSEMAKLWDGATASIDGSKTSSTDGNTPVDSASPQGDVPTSSVQNGSTSGTAENVAPNETELGAAT